MAAHTPSDSACFSVTITIIGSTPLISCKVPWWFRKRKWKSICNSNLSKTKTKIEYTELAMRTMSILNFKKISRCNIQKEIYMMRLHAKLEHWAVKWKEKYKTSSPHSVMAKVLDCNLKVSKFKLQSSYHIHFRANILGKGMTSLILPAIG